MSVALVQGMATEAKTSISAHPGRRLAGRSAGLLALLALAGCPSNVPGGGAPGGDGPADDPGSGSSDSPAEPVGLKIEPQNPNVDVDESIPLSATLIDGSGNVLPGDVEPTWSTVDTGFATVDHESGMLTGVASGTTRVTALYQGLQGQTTVTVGDGGGEPPCEGAITVCGGRYYSCDGGANWEEQTPGACSLETPENCSCGHYLGLYYNGNPNNHGYCTDVEPEWFFAPTCDCNCVPDPGCPSGPPCDL